MPNLVIVSNRLPVSVKKVDGKLEFFESAGGVSNGLSPYTKRRGTKWIGWPGLPSDDLTAADKVRIVREFKKKRCYPLFLTQQQIDDFYSGYSNGVLWLMLHDLPVRPYKDKLWQAYRKVNALYTDEITRLSKPGSTVWVHDYQLMLVPQMLRRTGRDDRIGFFLHTPFPVPRIFTSLKEARALLRGVLGADLIGFHTTGYTKHFLKSCEDVLDLRSDQGKLLVGERSIQATEFPIGIDYSRFAAATRRRGNQLTLLKLRRKYRGKKIIVMVDRLDPSKGLSGRLKAYQLLLRQNPRFVGKVVLVMIVAPSRTDVPEYQAVKKQLDKLLVEINKEFASPKWQPVDFIYETIPLERVTQYYQIARVAFIAPFRDGMNLVAKEFIASKRQNDGVLVLSETAGAAEQLQDAILVNPAKPQMMADGLLRALTMPRVELRRRARAMQELVQNSSVQKWAETFMDTLQRPHTLVPRYTKVLGRQQAEDIAIGYKHARKRLLLLDYDGVLRRFKTNPAAASPTEHIMKLLENLSADSKNEIVIISGRGKAELGDWFGHLPIALAAEHGALFRRKAGKNWHSTSLSGKDWQRDVRALFDYYAEQTPGALVERKEWSLAWHYRAANPYYTQKHLVQLRRLLKPITKRYGLCIEEGHKVLEVRPLDVNKGKVTREWLIHDHDFVLAIGDDVTDEDMFAALPLQAYSIKVGHGKTYARYRVKGVPAVLNLLAKL